MRDGVAGPLPSGGPYYVASQAPGRTVLLRNPGYTGTRPRRPERIVYDAGLPTARATAELDGGRTDYVPFDFDTTGPLAQGGELERRFGAGSAEAEAGRQRYFASPAPGVDLLVFNTRRGPFRDVRLRRAVNAALDRPAHRGRVGRAAERPLRAAGGARVAQRIGVPGRRSRPGARATARAAGAARAGRPLLLRPAGEPPRRGPRAGAASPASASRCGRCPRSTARSAATRSSIARS